MQLSALTVLHAIINLLHDYRKLSDCVGISRDNGVKLIVLCNFLPDLPIAVGNLYLIVHHALLNSFHWFCGSSIQCLTTRVAQSVLPFAKVTFMNCLYYTMERALSYVIYVVPLVWFSEWVSHIRISLVTVRSYAPAVFAMQPGYRLTSIMMPIVSCLHSFFCYQFFMVTM